MVSSDIATAMVAIYGQKHGLSEAEARKRMANDPGIQELMREEVGGIRAAIARDHGLAFHPSKPRLEPILGILKRYMNSDDAAGANGFPSLAQAPSLAVDLGAGTAVYTVAFSEQWPFLRFIATDRVDPESSDVYPTGLHQTRESLRLMAAECEPAPVANGRQLLFVDGAGPCAVRAGDIVRLDGLQRADLNGKTGIILKKRPDGERFAVRLHGSDSAGPMAIRAKNLRFEQPGWYDGNGGTGSESDGPDGGNGGGGDTRDVEGELQRLRQEVLQLARRDTIRRIETCALDLERRATWEQPEAKAVHGQAVLVSSMSLLSQVGFAQPLLWQQALEAAALLLAPGGTFMQYDTDKWGGFANEEVMQPVASRWGLTLCGKAEPVAYRDEQDGRFYCMLWRKNRIVGSTQ